MQVWKYSPREFLVERHDETINTFSSHMKLDKIKWILIDDDLLNLTDLEILTTVVSVM